MHTGNLAVALTSCRRRAVACWVVARHARNMHCCNNGGIGGVDKRAPHRDVTLANARPAWTIGTHKPERNNRWAAAWFSARTCRRYR